MSLSTSSFASFKQLRSTLVDVFRAYRSRSSSRNSIDGSNHSIAGVAKNFRISYSASPRLVKNLVQRSLNAAASGSGMGKDDDQLEAPAAAPSPSPSPSPPPPTPSSPPSRPFNLPRPTFPTWARWVLGSILSAVISVWMPTLNRKNLLRIGGEAEVIVHGAENVAEVVEKVANVAENVSLNIADNIPGDGNKFKQAALIVEHVSKEVSEDAQIAERIIHKVDAVTQDLEDLERMAEPIIKNAVRGHSNTNRKKL